MVARKKIDSNETNSFYAEEGPEIGKLPANPVWKPLEPNSYSDFGGSVTLLARNPINSSRQRKKGDITDLEASGGLNQDFTQTNTADILQGFMFSDFRRKPEMSSFPGAYADTFTASPGTDNATKAGHGIATGDGPFTLSNVGGALPAGLAAATNYWAISTGANTYKFATSRANALAGTAVDITDAGTGTHTMTRVPVVAATDDSMTVAAVPAGLRVGSIVKATGFVQAANNGLHVVTAFSGFKITFGGSALADEATPPATASLVVVGFEAAAADIVVHAADGAAYPFLSSTALDFLTLGLIPGEWLFVGSDDVENGFVNAVNNGFKRVQAVEAHKLTLDRSILPMLDDAGTGRAIRFFLARVLKNELGVLIKRRSYHLERQLGAPDNEAPNAVQAEYLRGAVASELTLTAETADKLNVDLDFIALDDLQRTAGEGLLAGTRRSIIESDYFNTSSDIKTMRLSVIVPGSEAAAPLFGYMTEFSLSINNNLTVDKAIGVLGGFEVTAGTFEVMGSATAYFSTIEAVRAVRQNKDCSLHGAFVKNNAGVVFDMPLVALGDARLEVEQDEPITLPLAMDAATAVSINPNTDYTLLFAFFDYLPTIAEA